MRTSIEEVIQAFTSALCYNSDEAKVACLRYYIEQDGTFTLPREISVISADRESPDELLERLIRELEEHIQQTEAEIERMLAKKSVET